MTPAGPVDVVPLTGEFLPNGHNGFPIDRFHNNPRGQQAVRGLKEHSDAHRLA